MRANQHCSSLVFLVTQVTVWDMSLEQDDDAELAMAAAKAQAAAAAAAAKDKAKRKGKGKDNKAKLPLPSSRDPRLADIPPQLLFIHAGQVCGTLVVHVAMCRHCCSRASVVAGGRQGGALARAAAGRRVLHGRRRLQRVQAGRTGYAIMITPTVRCWSVNLGRASW